MGVWGPIRGPISELYVLGRWLVILENIQCVVYGPVSFMCSACFTVFGLDWSKQFEILDLGEEPTVLTLMLDR